MTVLQNNPNKKLKKRRQRPDSYLSNPNLKGKGIQIPFTPDQVAEYAKCAENPDYFIKTYVKIITLDKGLVPFKPWDFQEKVINTVHNNRFVILKYPRQTGKSTTVVSYFLWMILFNPEQNIAILANKGELARQLLDKIKLAYEHIPLWLQQGIEKWNEGRIVLENKSKIIATSTSSSAARGGSYNAILLDEFAFVEPNMQEKFFSSVYPTISSGKSSKVIIVSTPNGMGNLFYKLWADATNKDGPRNEYIPLEVNWWDVPGRDEAWKKQTIANTSERQFQAEFECQFLGSLDTLINPNYIRAMVHKNPIFSRDGVDILEVPQKDHAYAFVCDVSRGMGLDYSAFVVIDITNMPFKTVAKYRDNKVSPLLFPNVIFTTANAYNKAFVMIEINDNGGQVADILLEDLEYDNLVFVSNDKKSGQKVGFGFGQSGQSLQRGPKTSRSVKRLGCTLFKNLVENQKLIIEDLDLISELSTFVMNKDTYMAEEGCNDDLAMSMVMFSWMINQPMFKEITNADLRTALYQKQMQEMEDQMTPFGIIDTGLNQNKLPVGVGSDTWLIGPDDDSLWLMNS